MGTKMSIVEDFNFYLMHGSAGSLKEVVKQTMLSQEVIFRKQVQELHRLHRMQKHLMEDSVLKELNGYGFWKMITQSTFKPVINPIRHSAMAEERLFSSGPMLESTPSVKKDFLGENIIDYSRLQHRTFDLQLPADQHVNEVGKDLLGKGNGWDLRTCIDLNSQSFNETDNLTLSIGGDTGKKGNGKSTWYDKITRTSSLHVINLELTDTISKEDSKSVLTPSDAVPITGDSSHWLPSSTLGDVSESCKGRNSLNEGLKEQHGDNAPSDILESLTSHKAFKLDLNIAQLDNSSYLNDSVVAFTCLSTDGSSDAFDSVMGKFCDDGTHPCTTSGQKPNIYGFNESSTVLLEYNVANPTLIVRDSKNSSSKVCASSGVSLKEINRTEAWPIDLESMSGPLSELCEDIHIDNRNSGRGNIESSLELPKGNYADRTTAEVTETREQDTVFLHPCKNGRRVEVANSVKSPTSCKFNCITDDSSSCTKTVQSATYFQGSNILLCQFGDSQLSQSGEQDLRSSDRSELKHQCWDKKKEESTAEDIFIQKAAESLIHFSFASYNQDCWFKVGSNGIQNEQRDRPQHSLDSYESIVLKLTESSVDDYCVSSKPFEVNEPNKKDFGVKLRRGRRLKDFQRDVLPSLSSLSIHEIREDVGIMEAVIRSREYKRMRSKMSNGEGNWFAPVKSQRSRRNYVARRYYS